MVVLGAAGGIGAAVAERAAAKGASLLLADAGTDLRGEGHDPAAIEEVAERLRARGASVLTDSGDLRAPDAPARLLRRAEERLGPIYGIVHAAGFARDAGLPRQPDADLADAFELSVATSVRLLRESAELFQKDGRGGSVVLLVSPTALFGVARKSAEAACTGAVVALVRTAALELRKHGIRVNAVAPTARTRQTADSPHFRSIRSDSMTPEQVAPLVTFLLSDRARDISGECLGAAGGRVYAITTRETTGAFLGPVHDESDVERELRTALSG